MSHNQTQHTQSSEQVTKRQKMMPRNETDFLHIPEQYYETARLVAALTEPSAAQHLSLQEVDNINSKAAELETLKVDAEVKFPDDEKKSTNEKKTMRYAEDKISEKAQEVIASLQGYKDKVERGRTARQT